ncbi:MAG: winged helix-turn-helix domain-containing protein [Candidatus Heimdallarchaeota archaeon]|nr:winged helix-turn-helix domain-containing protein [Candidatus Heimdallarchaeota archaeon]MDH5645917.1 winged helix-turn-helix domain-containing protein [Candidatus Heimdallarchaeota archaeon]
MKLLDYIGRFYLLSTSQRALLSILQDDTRNKILECLNTNPSHPDVLVDEIGVSRTAIEKHLKQLLSFGVIERRTQTVPRLRYIYSLTLAAQNLIDAISVTSDTYIENTIETWQEQLTKMEQAFIFGIIQKDEYEQIKLDLEEKLGNLNSDK